METSVKSDEQIRKNMLTILAQKLKQQTWELKRMENIHFEKVKEIHGLEGQ